MLTLKSDFIRTHQRNTSGSFPELETIISHCFGNDPWAQAYVEKVLEWMKLASAFGQLDLQLVQLEQFRARYHIVGTESENWTVPVPGVGAQPRPELSALVGASNAPEKAVAKGVGKAVTPAQPARPRKDPLDGLRTGKYQGYSRNMQEANDMYEKYLASNDRPAKSMVGFPATDEGKRALVKQAFEAMVQLEGSKEAEEFAEGKRESTAYKKISTKGWTDFELETKAWMLLVS